MTITQMKRISPDSKMLVGRVMYYVYNYHTLLEHGFVLNRNLGPSIFAFCPFCRGYRWFLGMSSGMDKSDSYQVCDTCDNHLTATRVVDNAY